MHAIASVHRMSIDELTTDQIEELQGELLRERERLEELLRQSKVDTLPVEPSEAIGRLTRMDAIQQQEMAKASRATYGTKLRQVRAALEAFGRDEYGYCRSCEEPVGYRRLKARPESPFCLSCQDAKESSRD